jgi:MFS family permease
MVAMDSLRFVFTLFIAFAVLAEQGTLPAPDEVKHVVGTRTGLYLLLVLATLLLGCAEVLRDNCNQTLMPNIVAAEHLERANGRVWAIESAANTFIGPPIGTLLLVLAFSIPFFVDAASFFVAAALVAAIPGSFRAQRPEHVEDRPWKADLIEGFRWLWRHPLLRTMAIILGFMNMANMMSGAITILFAQDVLHVTPLTFTFMGFGFAAGAVAGGYVGPWMSERLGAGPCLNITMAAAAVTPLLVGLSSSWVVVGVLYAAGTVLMSAWNVITVTLRQTIIPPHLLGRVNSVYRFFGLGMMPIGAVLGGVVVSVAAHFTGHDMALRWAFFTESILLAVVYIVCRSSFTTERIETARAAAA